MAINNSDICNEEYKFDFKTLPGTSPEVRRSAVLTAVPPPPTGRRVLPTGGKFHSFLLKRLRFSALASHVPAHFKRAKNRRQLLLRISKSALSTTPIAAYIVLRSNMARRFSYAEKGKALDLAMAPPQRKRIRAPEMDKTDLVHQNSLTLIGRLTNPQEQKMWTMIPYISSRWELRGRAVGSDLRNHCFQFRFDYADDLQKVLNNRPYQYAKWMLILQKWEPIISPTFPSQIPFWIQLKGIPLHYWKKELLCDIGKEIGDYKEQILTNLTAKIKVEVNGLQPLVKDAIIEFEGGQEALVVFEYENLGKHCSYCYSLSHEVEQCQEKPLQGPQKESSTRSTERDRPFTSKPGQATEQRPFNLRRDRHGRPFGDRPSSNRSEKERPTEHDRSRNHTAQPLQTRQRQTPTTSPTYTRNHLDPTSQHHHQDQIANRVNQAGDHLEGARRLNHLNTPTRQVWREKPPSLVDHEDASTSLLPIQITGRNLDLEAFTPPHRIRSESEIMSSLQEVTVQYANVEDPLERAARMQRILEGETRGLMADTARSMYTAQLSQQTAPVLNQREQDLICSREGEDELAVVQRPIQTQEQPRRPRGRPPTKKPTQTAHPSEAGPSKRKVKQGRISPFLRISPLSRTIQNRASPVTHNHGTRRSRVTLQRGSTGPTPPRSLPPPSTTIVPAIRKAVRKDKADFHNLRDPLP
ncbi:unnamed protein product [Microthlaspi erraticum]|uniref:DUF4283 domain-containing protein n=1 Tax=Microthlaspi erraticum TaxID=1685480 RepID=A0A6D2KR36_9BRAS|nr:unnamed protein product [Microthlaspi erraticum]CAA7046635.1 unnamed protein product [Microthlaspi erraticum]CAA7059333.1 unnamed protein product [Microthlaspi erraticum]